MIFDVEYHLIETTKQIGLRFNKTWFKNDDIRLTPEYQKHLHQIENERWINLDVFLRVIKQGRQRYDDIHDDSHQGANIYEEKGYKILIL